MVNSFRKFFLASLLLPIMLIGGCDFAQLPPGEDRRDMALLALGAPEADAGADAPLSFADAVRLALGNNFNLKAAQLEIAYQEEARRGGMLRLLPQLQTEAALQYRNHPDAAYSEGLDGGRTLGYSYSREQTQFPIQARLLWNVLDFGAGYLRARQTGERLLQSHEQVRRLRQQTAMEAAGAYWRARAASENAAEAVLLVGEMETQLASIREARERGVLAEAEAARRELAVLGGMVEAERWVQRNEEAGLELSRVLGLRREVHVFAGDPEPDSLAELGAAELEALQRSALLNRPELFQADSQARISLDDARLALLQMAPNVGLSMAFEHNDDKHLSWNDWFGAGLRVSWNLLSLPARLSEKRAAEIQNQVLRQKNLAMSAAILAQVGLARSEWRSAGRIHARLASRLDTRGGLVESLILGEESGQVRSTEVLQERVRLLNERAAARLQEAEIRAALARLASAVGLDIDDNGNYLFERF